MPETDKRPAATRAALPPRWRKLVGTVAMIVLVLSWALGAMALAQGRITVMPAVWQFIAYVVLGIGWIVPAGLLIRWMLKFDRRPDTL
ncbi:DUF2842 domain-containing protein [Ancylobacter sp. A5.8]|uniref:DUF2842 domain-containing protein n=1 Tax=Ancylobacter gelatini TaxID=2919920 RepID=UPI001F4E22AD|nr:DUF2842 domain-containing protein [Ancylobacter gelatini]MCJ8141622.1 DUF2842 domain-containing protein [Ancylobacter gelatini]